MKTKSTLTTDGHGWAQRGWRRNHSGELFAKKTKICAIVVRIRRLLLGSTIFCLCAGGYAAEETAKSQPEPAAAEKKNEPESRVKKGPNGETIITLDAAMQKLMGLQTAALAKAELNPELKAYGRVLDISPLAALVAELTTAQAANEASQAELRRLKTLAAQNNASERALQAAEAAAVRDQTQVESVRLRLLATWGSAISDRNDLPAFVQSLGSLASALVELDVPAGQPPTATPTGARLVTLSEQAGPLPAQLLGPAPMVDTQLQGRGFLLLVSPNSSRLAPGAAVSGFLSLPGEPQPGVAVPRNAVVRFNGTTWVYLQTSEETFQRTEVKLDSPLAEGWFVREGLKPQDKVVTVGTQQLLSEELKGQAGE
jgi:multidrug efflux pump subunit AcrA (membrane-fusion protein)